MKPDTKPTPAERAKMVQGLVAMGYKGPDLAAIIKAGRTRGQMADDMVAMQRVAPKRTATP